MPDPKAIIHRVVVLMLENRSFDHMLGFMKPQIPGLNGLDGTETNPERILRIRLCPCRSPTMLAIWI